MQDYASWDQTTEKVTSLLLDDMNPRIPGDQLDQRAMIAELVEHDKVYNLAKDIAEVGWFPGDALIGLRDADLGKTVILEGNRRLAALKLLISPEMAPEKWIAKFRSLKPALQIEKVRVLHATSREAAAPIILQRHTGQNLERWSIIMQARFYRNLTSGGLKLKDVAEQYGVTVGEISNFLRIDEMYRIARHLPLPDDVRKKVEDSRNFPASILDRVIATPETRKFLGIEFQPDGSVKGSIAQEEFQKGYTRIIIDIAGGKIDTRSLNKASAVKEYLNDLGADKPNHSKKGAFTSDDIGTNSGTPPPPKPGGVRKKPTPRTWVTVIPPGVTCRLKSPRIKEVFGELRSLKVSKYPNSAAVMLRILLELSLYHYLDAAGKLKAIVDKTKGKDKGRDWSPTLKQMLTPFLDDPDLQLDPLALKKLKTLATQRDHPLTVDSMDSFVHSKYSMPSERDIRGFWEILAPLFEVILSEPTK
jgi:hypothetical protein